MLVSSWSNEDVRVVVAELEIEMLEFEAVDDDEAVVAAAIFFEDDDDIDELVMPARFE